MGFGFSGEMIFIFFLALILFGPKKLPEIGRQIGRLMNEFRRASNEFRSQIESEIDAADATRPQILPPMQAPLGSLASRIFNSPAAGQIEASETQASETPAAEHVTEPAVAENAIAVETAPAPSPTTKVAPDA